MRVGETPGHSVDRLDLARCSSLRVQPLVHPLQVRTISPCLPSWTANLPLTLESIAKSYPYARPGSADGDSSGDESEASRPESSGQYAHPLNPTGTPVDKMHHPPPQLLIPRPRRQQPSPAVPVAGNTTGNSRVPSRPMSSGQAPRSGFEGSRQELVPNAGGNHLTVPQLIFPNIPGRRVVSTPTVGQEGIARRDPRDGTKPAKKGRNREEHCSCM